MVKHHLTYQKNVSSQALIYNTTTRQEQESLINQHVELTYSIQPQNATEKIMKKHQSSSICNPKNENKFMNIYINTTKHKRFVYINNRVTCRHLK
jgi:hypothetical protein